MDNELRTYLDSYGVKDADEALLNRIMQDAQNSKVVPFVAMGHALPFMRIAAVLLVAVLGFSGGFVSRDQAVELSVAQSASAGDTSVYDVILNPQDFEEIML